MKDQYLQLIVQMVNDKEFQLKLEVPTSISWKDLLIIAISMLIMTVIAIIK